MHHELKTPLTSIKGCAQLMQRRGAYSEWAVRAIVSETDRLTAIVDQLLTALCLEEGREFRFAPVDLVGVARTTAEWAQAHGAAHRVLVDAPAGPLIGQWNAVSLVRVLRDLLSNALTFSPHDGEIRVRVEDHGQEALVAVADQGVGIPPAALPHVFDRFYRVDDPEIRSVQGIGLGLYCCKLLVEAHGGRIWAASTPGKGSTFSFALPYAPPAQPV